MPALYMQCCCHQLVPAATMGVAATLLEIVWIVCSDGPHPHGYTEQAGCALAAATCLVKTFVVW